MAAHPPELISQDAAVEIARQRAAANGWGLVEPVEAVLRRPWVGKGGVWEVHSDPRLRGTKARFRIDAVTGAVIGEGYIPH